MRVVAELPLVGPGGERISFARTVHSHGLTSLPPFVHGQDAFEAVVPTSRGPRLVRLSAPGGTLRVEARTNEVVPLVRHMLRLDVDLSPLYERAARDRRLAWIGPAGAGRLLRAPTVFEEVVKTICTTNCAWSATQRMVGALVGHLGEPVPGDGRRAFPTPEAMAAADESFYRDVARAGYRGAYLRELARRQAEGEVELEAWPGELTDDELERELLALPGVGPYAAAHVMLLLGRTHRLVLDSWTRPTYAALANRGRPVDDATIVRRFRRYGAWAGLAFWLLLTADWVADGSGETVS